MSVSPGSDAPIHFDPTEFRENFDRHRFTFSHSLADHPLFKLPRLIELAKATQEQRPHELHYDSGAKDIGQRWDETPTLAESVDQTIRAIEDRQAWIILKRCERDPDYKALLNSCMGQILRLTGPELEKIVDFKEVIIFVTSPKRLTTYHIDSECNFILQISGKKMIYVFDKDDRDILPEEEIERFWTVDTNSARYKPQFQDRAFPFELQPGNGIHIPIGCPHWLQNDNNISITVSINFHFINAERRDIYRVNYYLRKLGLHPSPPFMFPARDAAKRTVIGAMRRTAQLPKMLIGARH